MAFIESLRDKLCCSGTNNYDDQVSISDQSLSHSRHGISSFSKRSRSSRRRRGTSKSPAPQRRKRSQSIPRRTVSRDSSRISRSRSIMRQDDRMVEPTARLSSVERSQLDDDGYIPKVAKGRSTEYYDTYPEHDDHRLLYGESNGLYYPKLIKKSSSPEDRSTLIVANDFVSRSNQPITLDIPGEISIEDNENLSAHSGQLSKQYSDYQREDLDIDERFNDDYTRGIIKGQKSSNDRPKDNSTVNNTRTSKQSLFSSLFKGSSSGSKTDQDTKTTSSRASNRRLMKGLKPQKRNDESEEREWIKDMERNQEGDYTRTPRSTDHSLRPLYPTRDVSPLSRNFSPDPYWTIDDDDIPRRERQVRTFDGRYYDRKRSPYPGIDDLVQYPNSGRLYNSHRQSSSRGFRGQRNYQPSFYDEYYMDDWRRYPSRTRGVLSHGDSLSQEATSKKNNWKKRRQRKKTQVKVITLKRPR